MTAPTEHPLPDSFVTVCIRDEHGHAWDVQVSRADPQPERHALVMLRAYLVRGGPIDAGDVEAIDAGDVEAIVIVGPNVREVLARVAPDMLGDPAVAP